MRSSSAHNSARARTTAERKSTNQSEGRAIAAVAAGHAGQVSRLSSAEVLTLQRQVGNRTLGTLMRARSDQAADDKGGVAEAKGLPDPGLVALAAKEIAKLLKGGAGATAEGTTATLTGAEVVTIGGVSLVVVGAMAGWVIYYAQDARRAGKHYEEQARRAAIAQYLREMGLITEDEAREFVLHGHLFVPNVPRWPMTRDGRWCLFDVTKLEVATSKLGYQVYVMRDAAGVVLYIGRSGGEDGLKPGNWTDRVREHIDHIDKTDWIGSVDTITVHSELTFAEAMALEEDLIREHPESHNKKPGDFSKKFPEGDLAGSLRSALKRPRWRFRTEIGQKDPLRKSPVNKAQSARRRSK